MGFGFQYALGILGLRVWGIQVEISMPTCRRKSVLYLHRLQQTKDLLPGLRLRGLGFSKDHHGHRCQHQQHRNIQHSQEEEGKSRKLMMMKFDLTNTKYVYGKMKRPMVSLVEDKKEKH